MGSDKAQDEGSRGHGDDERSGHSGEGSDSVLRLIRSRRLAQFRETAGEPDDTRQAASSEDDLS